jgi:ubiquinone/menaquinone biosynthesis C-methylase UbiE
MPLHKPNSFDLKAFWQEHDKELAEQSNHRDLTLSHDLYRGMPDWFNAFFAHFQQRAVLRLFRKCNLQTGMRALDIGCGTGRWTGLLLGMGLKCFAFDMGAQALQYAAKRWERANFSLGQLPFLAFADESFDLAISVTVLQHVPRPLQLQAIQAIGRALKPSGYLIACESTDIHETSSHVFSNSKGYWLDMFSDAGLELAGMTACEYLPYVKLFQWSRDFWQKRVRHSNLKPNVSSIAQLLKANPLLAFLTRFMITLSYPLEYVSSEIFPQRWANKTCFLLRKP